MHNRTVRCRGQERREMSAFDEVNRVARPRDREGTEADVKDIYSTNCCALLAAVLRDD